MSSSCAEDLLLDVELLDDRLDDQFAAGEVAERGRRREVRHRGVAPRRVELALRDLLAERVADRRDRLRRRRGVGIVQTDAAAGLREHLRDAAAHRARADHGDGELGGVRVEGHGRFPGAARRWPDSSAAACGGAGAELPPG